MLEIFKQLDLFRYRLDHHLCPICGEKPDLSVMDDTELAEFGISGMCKKCQDTIFKGI